MIDKQLELFASLNYPIILVDLDNWPLWANRKFLSLQSISKKDLEVTEISFMIKEMLTAALRDGQLTVEKKRFQATRSPLKIAGKKVAIISLFDISQYVQLLAKQEMFENLSEYLPEGIILFQDTILYSNPALEKMLGYTGSELLGRRFLEFLEPSQQKPMDENLQQLMLQNKSKVETILAFTEKNGQSLWTRIKTRLVAQGDTTLFLAIIIDISKERSEMQRLDRLANTDVLTGVYNRRKIDELFLIEYKRAKRYSRHLSALFLDIDHFKQINDTYGHNIGDEVLKKYSQLVQAHLRETDVFARWGGEEFIILLPETSSEKAMILAEHIRNSIATFDFAHVKNVTTSIGITPLKGKEQVNTFLKRLDQALYIAKEKGRNQSILL
jgi:diguanylate cyclase (GGDEF)-like protein/PAS domain S-box-containing protein